MNCMIYLYTGTGGGKTTNALGLALRSVGHGRKVVIVQFLKWWKKTGEYKIAEKLKPFYEIYQFGRAGWFELEGDRKTYKFGDMSFTVNSLEELDKKLAQEGLEFAKKCIKEKKPDLLVLDEINLALHWKLLDVKEVVEFLKSIPKNIDIVLTGRYAQQELIDASDFVNEVSSLKQPPTVPATEGIQY